MDRFRICNVILFAALVSAISNCVEPYGVPALRTDYHYLVVQGFLIDGTDSTIIRLGRTSTLENESKETAEGNAGVQIEDDTGNHFVLEEHSKGVYAHAPLQLDADRKYRLHIRTADNKEYVSDYVTTRKSPDIDEVVWKKQNGGIQIYINSKDPENQTWYYLWTLKETWKYSSRFYSIFSYENGEPKLRSDSEELFYCWRTLQAPNVYIYSTQTLSKDVIHNHSLYRLPENSIKLYYGYSLLVQQHAISKEAYEYWSVLLKNNERVGTLFDVLPSSDIGNIHCIPDTTEPVIGYFSISSVTKKRIQIDRKEITGPGIPYEPNGYESCEEEFVPVDLLSRLLGNKLIIRARYNPDILEGYVVAQPDCVDCRLHGGTITKPDFWKE